MGKFWDFLGEILESGINEFEDSYKKEMRKQRQKEEELMIQSVESAQETVKALRDMLHEFSQDYKEFESQDKVVEKIGKIIIISSLFAKKQDLFDALINYYNWDCDFDGFTYEIQELEDMLNEFLEEYDDEEAETLTKTFNRFFAQMNAVYEILTESDEDDIDLEQLYEKSQKAAKTVMKKLGVVVKMLDEAIEEAYE